MERGAQFWRNAGLGGLLRMVLVGGIFCAIAFHFQGYALLNLLLGSAVGIPVGLWMSQEPSSRGGLHTGFGIAVAFGSAVVGQLREQIQLADETLVVGLCLLVALYLSSYFVLLSDSRVVILKE
jgi:predicted MFS family arabinose efflux permease